MEDEQQESKVSYKTESIGAFARGVEGAISGGESEVVF